jgi:hypothetical protein
MENEIANNRNSVILNCSLLRCLLLLLACALVARGQCSTGDATLWGSSLTPIRLDSNHVETYGQTWATGTYGSVWTPYEEAWQQHQYNKRCDPQ